MENDSKKIMGFSVEKIVLVLLGLTFFIGAWHAFPMLDVVGDESYYVGGVLRAIESHTIVPLANDVPYGTLTYLLSYITIAVLLVGSLPFFGFDITSLKLFLIQSPWVMYLFLRLTSSFLALAMLFFVYNILKKEFEDKKVRLFMALLLFTNIITTTVLHTGKMWVLSQLLVLISFYYLYESVATGSSQDKKKTKKNIFLSVLFSFLAFSNFPLNFFSLINISLVLFFFRKDKELLRQIGWAVLAGLSFFILITSFNFTGIKNQIISIFTDYHPIGSDFVTRLNFVKSFLSYFTKLLYLFPLILLTLVLSLRNKVKNLNLLIISSAYFFTYFFTIVVVANYSLEFHSGLRYLFPFGFFLLFIIASFNIKFQKIFYYLGFISVLYCVMVLYYISVPTTYNDAYNWVSDNLGDKKSIIVNRVAELQLIKNKQSANLIKSQYCATKCKSIIDLNLNSGFKPIVSDLIMSNMPGIYNSKEDIYYIEEDFSSDSSLKLVQSFENRSAVYHSIDYNIGNYFDLDLFRIKNLGKNIYIYQKI